MLTTDGADHRRLRTLISQGFTPRRVEALRPAVKAVVASLLDRLANMPPDSALDTLPTTVEHPELAAKILQEIYTALEDLVATRKADPGPDMTSTLLTAHTENDDRPSHQELVCTLFLMIGAGTDTVTAHLDHTIYALLTHPDQRAVVLRDPARWGDVIEESLRLQAPIMHMPLHFITADIPLDERTTLRAGDLLLPSFGAHGRDPDVHQRPDVFDMDRADKQHLAFGHGAHFCLGAHLARIEATVAVSALFTRFPHSTLAPEPGGLEPVPSFIVNDYRTLLVVLGASGCREFWTEIRRQRQFLLVNGVQFGLKHDGRTAITRNPTRP